MTKYLTNLKQSDITIDSYMSLNLLQNIGLTENEALIYELLVKSGEIPVSTLIRESKLKRPTVYKILYSLQKKELVSILDKRKIMHAKPESPQKLLELAQKQQEAAENIKASLHSLLPGLNLMYVNSTEKPVVRTYEGIEGLKEIYNDTLREEKPIFSLLQTSAVDDRLFQWLNETYVKKRHAKKIHAKVIVAEGTWSKEYKNQDTKGYRTSAIVPSDLFPFQHEVDIYGDKVAFIHNKKDEPLIGIVIHHPSIAATCKAWFDLAWNGATK